MSIGEPPFPLFLEEGLIVRGAELFMLVARL
jgi:hypothetical protein